MSQDNQPDPDKALLHEAMNAIATDIGISIDNLLTPRMIEYYKPIYPVLDILVPLGPGQSRDTKSIAAALRQTKYQWTHKFEEDDDGEEDDFWIDVDDWDEDEENGDDNADKPQQ